MFLKHLATILLVGIVFISGTFGQTKRLQLNWEANPENDVFLYRIYRSQSPDPNTKIDSLIHPQTKFIDDDVHKGVLYYYRLRAIDYSLNVSPFSQTVQASIPALIGWPGQITLAPDTTILFDLTGMVQDADHSYTDLQWQIEGQQKLNVNVIDNNQTLQIQTPSDWAGTETLTIKVFDPDSLYDRTVLKVNAGASSANAPVFTQISRQNIPEDGNRTINLFEYVNDEDSPPDSLTFTMSAGEHLGANLNKERLTVEPAENWYGKESISVFVEDESGLQDSTSFEVNVYAKNDAPKIFDLPNITMQSDTTVVTNLGGYVSDVDDAREDLSWEFSNNNKLELQFDDASDALSITSPPDWQGFEYIWVNVMDDSAASDLDTLVVQVLNQSYPPVIGELPEITFAEDDSTTLPLNGYVEDEDDNVEQLYWQSVGGEHVTVYINHAANRAMFKADKDWYGSEQLILKVSDPSMNSDSATITITVSAVNDPPVLRVLPNINLSQNKQRTLDLQDYTSDVDNPVSDLSWTYSGNAAVQIQIDDEGVAQFSADDNWNGVEEIQFYVSDTQGGRDTAMTSVYSQNEALAPQISGLDTIQITEDGERLIDLNEKVEDSDHNAVEINWKVRGDEFIEVTIDNNANTMHLAPQSNWYGKETLFIRAADPDNNVDFDTLAVTVLSVNDLPQVLSPGTISLYENTVYSINLRQYVKDADGISDIKKVEVLNGGNGFIGHYLDLVSWQLTFFTPRGYMGKETFLMRAIDHQDEKSEAVFTVEVQLKQFVANVGYHFFGSGTTMKLEWQTLSASRDFVQYGLKAPYDQASKKDTELSTNHSVLLNNLEPNTRYYFRIVSEGTDGNISYSRDSSFVTGKADEDVNVFPIPYRPNSAADQHSGINFVNLPVPSKVMVFNLLGDLVFKKEYNQRSITWKATNNHGKYIGSGVYLYVIRDQNKNSVAEGKLIIVR